MNTRILCLAIISSLLVACGGGGGGENNAEPTSSNESVGVFLDSPVAGLHYETPSRSGLTNDRGEFSYLEGENVTFSIGNTTLGVAQGAAVITPFSLFNMTAPTRESAISAVLSSSEVSNYDRAMNIATLLQTFDRNANPDDDIDLGSAHTELLETTINLSVKATKFLDEPSLAAAKTKLGISTRRQLGQVASHLYGSMNLSIKSDLVNQIDEALNERHAVVTKLEHDDTDNITSQSSDTDNDGLVDRTITYDYDDAGNVASISNSATKTTEKFSYDNNNNLTEHLTDHLRKADIKQTLIYDANKISRLEFDHGDDGTVESAMTYQYDAEGQLSVYEVDHDNDGHPDVLTSFTYDDDKVSSYVEDDNNSGTTNLDITYQYDSEGNRISQEVNAATDGLPSNKGTFEYDTNGNVTRYQQDNDLDGVADYIESSTYDAGNHRTSYRRDLNADGTWDSITLYTYDSDGNRTSMTEDSDGDGVIDKQWSSNYDTETLDNGWDLIMEKLGSR